MDAMEQLEATLARTSEEVSFGAGALQDLMFELWAATKDTPAQPEVERWLTLTIERNLFSADEVRDALTTIRDLSRAVPADTH
jgi:hypothetical protein